MTLAFAIQDYASACRYLVELKQAGVSLGLLRMEQLMAALGNPESRFAVVHVAGTNGKGSVCAMIEAVLHSAGWKTGLYTSPHLVRLAERIQVSRVPLTNDQLVEYVRELATVVRTLEEQHGPASRPSYFEFMTAMALVHFARSGCDIAVIEVGLGGRLDATNVVRPEVSVITSIGLDHCELLGDTFAAIATEKAGIIKPGRPVIIGPLPPSAEEEIRTIAARQNAPLRAVAETFGDGIGLAPFPPTNLPGRYQSINAATATWAARTLGARWCVTEQSIGRALQHVDWPARWQRLAVSGRVVIVDSSHNSEGAAALDVDLAELQREFGRAPIVVFGVLGSGRAIPLMEVICRHAAEIQLVRPQQSRASTWEELESLVTTEFRGRVNRTTIVEAFPAAGQCRVGGPGDVVVVTGSIYLAGEVLAAIEPERGPFEGHLQDF